MYQRVGDLSEILSAAQRYPRPLRALSQCFTSLEDIFIAFAGNKGLHCYESRIREQIDPTANKQTEIGHVKDTFKMIDEH